MKIVLIKKGIVDNLYTEAELLELSRVESLYVIRKLKALADSQEHGFIEVKNKPNDSGQLFSEEHQIWFSKNEFKLWN